MKPSRAVILLKSRGKLDLLDPRPDAWTDEDLAIGLSRTYRWGGYSAWDLPLSVAQHSLAVLALREMEGPLTPAEALRELLHDATELSTLSRSVLTHPFRASQPSRVMTLSTHCILILHQRFQVNLGAAQGQ
jgi:hypothetical protein